MNHRIIPTGVRDLLPDEAQSFRKLENLAMNLFSKYGYTEVVPPMLEYMDVIEGGTGGKVRDQLLLMMDRTGDILALRPEFTVSIARLAATHLESQALPRRLCYSGSVFRHVQPQIAQYREFRQMGIELLGAFGSFADAEVIHIAGELLNTLGLTDYKISLNHIGIFNGLLQAMQENTLAHEEKEKIKSLITLKDMVALKALLQGLPIPEALKDTLLKLPVLHGGIEILGQLPYLSQCPVAQSAVEELIQVYEALKSVYGIDDRLLIDMGILRGFDYYTGVVFEGYSPRLGYGLLGGGRYDRLLDQFQAPSPATGFALGVERLALVLDEPESAVHGILVAGRDLLKVSRRAEELRKTNSVVISALEPASLDKAKTWVADMPQMQLIYVE